MASSQCRCEVKIKKGLLLAAAGAFHDLDLQISWARVHTWGRQIEDVFSLRTQRAAQSIVSVLEYVLLDQNQPMLIGQG